jgi:hypothetical protein
VSSFVVRDGETLRLSWNETVGYGRTDRTYDWNSTAFVLAAGDPRIEQEGCQPSFTAKKYTASVADEAATETLPANAEPPPKKAEPRVDSEPSAPSRYCYRAVRPTKLDGENRIIAVLAWPVSCGPWPTQAESDRMGKKVATKPFPGLHVVDEDCVAESENALREAAKASEAVTSSMHFGPIEAHWVRDGYR